MATKLTLYDCLALQAKMDIEETLERVFAGHSGIVGLPTVVRDTSGLRQQLIQSKVSPADFEPVLRQCLSDQLIIGQQHARTWTDPDADISELFKTREAQSEAFARWELFMTHLQEPASLEALKEAYRFAFEQYVFEKTTFKTEQQRATFLKMLKNEQESEILLNNLLEETDPRANCRLEGTDLHYNGEILHLEPIQAGILAQLWDELPHTIEHLIRNVLGSKLTSKDNTAKLSRRISDTNKRLKCLWGKPPKKRWINRSHSSKGPAYELSKPSGIIRK